MLLSESALIAESPRCLFRLEDDFFKCCRCLVGLGLTFDGFGLILDDDFTVDVKAIKLLLLFN